MINLECETVMILNSNTIFFELEKKIPYKDQIRRFYQTRLYLDDKNFSFHKYGVSLSLITKNNTHSYVLKWKHDFLPDSNSYIKKEISLTHLSYKDVKEIIVTDTPQLPENMIFLPIFYLKSYRSQFLYKLTPIYILFSLDTIDIISASKKKITTFHCIEVEQSTFNGELSLDYIQLLDLILALIPKNTPIVYPSKYHIAKSILDS